MSGTRPLLFLRSKDYEGLEEVWADLKFTQRMPRKFLLLTLLCLFVFAAGREARVEGAPRAEDFKRGEAGISKLQRLEKAAAARGPRAPPQAPSKSFPRPFSTASQ